MAHSHCTGQGPGMMGFYITLCTTHYTGTGTDTGNHCYRPQRSCGQGYVFTRVCDSVHRGGLRAGRPPWTRENPPSKEEPPWAGKPPGPGRTPRAGKPPQTRDQGEPPHPPDQADPPGTRQTPPPDQADTPGKQTPEYGLRAAGTHPTGMYSCFLLYSSRSLSRSRAVCISHYEDFFKNLSIVMDSEQLFQM